MTSLLINFSRKLSLEKCKQTEKFLWETKKLSNLKAFQWKLEAEDDEKKILKLVSCRNQIQPFRMHAIKTSMRKILPALHHRLVVVEQNE